MESLTGLTILSAITEETSDNTVLVITFTNGSQLRVASSGGSDEEGYTLFSSLNSSLDGVSI